MNYIHKITILTPTYNRISTLTRLYDSLVKQTFKDFEWLIIDDGSYDDTEYLINNWIQESKINLRYYKQKNGGKHRAINKGLDYARGELFFIVDSDDYLLPNSLEIVINKYTLAKKKHAISGIVGRRQYDNGEIVGSLNFTEIVTNSIDIRYRYNVTGDLVEIYELEKIKESPFPEFIGEKFCPEALVWNRLALKNDLLFFNTAIYVTEYLPGGLTANITKIRMKAPYASSYTYLELSNLNIPFYQKLKACINYWRFAYNLSYIKRKEIDKPNKLLSILGKPIGMLMYLKDLRKLRI